MFEHRCRRDPATGMMGTEVPKCSEQEKRVNFTAAREEKHAYVYASGADTGVV